jgi:hypothetical protein
MFSILLPVCTYAQTYLKRNNIVFWLHVTGVSYLGPHSETCSNLRHKKLPPKRSVSKFVCSISQCSFFKYKFHHF